MAGWAGLELRKGLNSAVQCSSRPPFSSQPASQPAGQPAGVLSQRCGTPLRTIVSAPYASAVGATATPANVISSLAAFAALYGTCIPRGRSREIAATTTAPVRMSSPKSNSIPFFIKGISVSQGEIAIPVGQCFQKPCGKEDPTAHVPCPLPTALHWPRDRN